MFERFQSNVHTFRYNFRWDDYVGLFQGPIAKSIVFIPVIGYVVLFNDAIIKGFGFTELSGTVDSSFFLGDSARLRLIYFGLISTALGNFIFLSRRPQALKQAKSQSEYVDFARKVFTPRDYNEIYGQISRYGHVTLYGNDMLHLWDEFWDSISGKSTSDYSYSKAIEDHLGLVTCLAI